jgi:guanine deaminase
MSDEEFMRMAIRKAMEGIKEGQLPFGAAVVKDGKVISCSHNTIIQDKDVTAHAEMNAIYNATRELHSLDLTGCTIYCTCEPCPMCLGACCLANISKVVYGAKVNNVDLEGFVVLETPTEIIELICDDKICVVPDYLREENLMVFEEWEKRHGRK